MADLLRSLLFVPGTRPDRFAKALASGADAVVFDLEDSVESGRKAEARAAIGAFLAGRPDDPAGGSAGQGALCRRLVRINAFGSPWIADDLALVSTLTAIEGVVLPKTETAAQVEEVAKGSRVRPVIVLLETARGVLNAVSIADADASIPALLFGAEDLTAEIGVPRTVDGEELVFARSQVVLAATTIGAVAIDAVFTHISSPDDLRRDAVRARALGFRGKMAIHPDQVAAINDVFSPTADEIDRARRLVNMADAALAKGEGVIRLDNQMVDTPIVLRARRVLALADAIGARHL
jgi:citrate lyase subunit beta/citryl-CoA lyase